MASSEYTDASETDFDEDYDMYDVGHVTVTCLSHDQYHCRVMKQRTQSII